MSFGHSFQSQTGDIDVAFSHTKETVQVAFRIQIGGIDSNQASSPGTATYGHADETVTLYGIRGEPGSWYGVSDNDESGDVSGRWPVSIEVRDNGDGTYGFSLGIQTDSIPTVYTSSYYTKGADPDYHQSSTSAGQQTLSFTGVGSFSPQDKLVSGSDKYTTEPDSSTVEVTIYWLFLRSDDARDELFRQIRKRNKDDASRASIAHNQTAADWTVAAGVGAAFSGAGAAAEGALLSSTGGIGSGLEWHAANKLQGLAVDPPRTDTDVVSKCPPYAAAPGVDDPFEALLLSFSHSTAGLASALDCLTLSFERYDGAQAEKQVDPVTGVAVADPQAVEHENLQLTAISYNAYQGALWISEALGLAEPLNTRWQQFKGSVSSGITAAQLADAILATWQNNRNTAASQYGLDAAALAFIDQAVINYAHQLSDPVTLPEELIPASWSAAQADLLASMAALTPVWTPAPAITGVNPASGPYGTVLRVDGNGLESVIEVSFGDLPALTVKGSNPLFVQSPPGTGTVALTARTLSGVSPPSPVAQFTYTDSPSQPVVTGVTPSQGPAAGGTKVVVNGSGLSNVTWVKFGSAEAGFTVVWDGQLSVTSPPGAGTVDITVGNGGSASAISPADRFTYVGPTVTSVTPATGPSIGGTPVVITGNGFTGATSVAFGTNAATDFSVHSDTEIQATSPPATGTVDITVTSAAGSSPSSASDQFSYT
jgi:hypothetical protein